MCVCVCVWVCLQCSGQMQSVVHVIMNAIIKPVLWVSLALQCSACEAFVLSTISNACSNIISSISCQ